MTYEDDKAVEPKKETASVSPSELATWNDCQRKWHYRYDQRIEPIDQSRPAPMASGQAVHFVVETICRDFPNEIPTQEDIALRARDCLEHEFEHNYEPEKQVNKYLPGVIRALNKIPDEIWKAHWFVERDISGTFGDVELHGRPDMYRLVDGLATGYEVDRLELIDVKTTKTEPLDFLLWSPQLRYYAAVLQKEYPFRVISYKYLCLPTTGTGPPPHSPAWPFTQAMFEATCKEIASMGRTFNRTKIAPRYSRACSFCEYSPICKNIITGADPQGIIEELYTERRPHD